MTSMKNKLIPIRDMLVRILPDATYHYWRQVSKKRYIIWAEDGEENSLNLDNKKAIQQVTGTIDLFTQTEYDPIADEIQEGLNELEIGWTLLDVNYEEETKLIHWEWEFKVV